MAVKAVVDQDTCIGCGLCCEMCDAVFRMNDDGKAEAFQVATVENHDDVQNAIDSCPVSAISWKDRASKGQVKNFPPVCVIRQRF